MVCGGHVNSCAAHVNYIPGLSPLTWTDGDQIKSVHFNELRTAITDEIDRRGLVSPDPVYPSNITNTQDAACIVAGYNWEAWFNVYGNYTESTSCTKITVSGRGLATASKAATFWASGIKFETYFQVEGYAAQLVASNSEHYGIGNEVNYMSTSNSFNDIDSPSLPQGVHRYRFYQRMSIYEYGTPVWTWTNLIDNLQVEFEVPIVGTNPSAKNVDDIVFQANYRQLRDRIDDAKTWTWPTEQSNTFYEVDDEVLSLQTEQMRDRVNEIRADCVCDCAYACTCDCNYCECDCNYACECDCNYCKTDGGGK